MNKVILHIVIYLASSSFVFSQIHTEWIQRFNSAFDIVVGMALDDSSEVFVTGYVSAQSSSSYAITTIKFSGDGKLDWVRYYQRADHFDTYAHAITVDKAHNVIVAGIAYDTSFGWIPIVLKYNNFGELLWVRHFSIKCPSDDKVFVVHDSEGNIILAGTQYNNSTQADYFIMKLDSLGNQKWIEFYDGNNSYEHITSTKLDKKNNIYVTGYCQGLNNYDYLTLKLNPEGVLKWVMRYDGGGFDMPKSMAIDSNNNLLITGSGFLTVKYDSLGHQLWSTKFNANGISYCNSESITTDDYGNSFITGNCYINGSGNNILTVKYNYLGELIWFNTFRMPNVFVCEGKVINISAQGKLYVTGNIGDLIIGGRDCDFITLKYDMEGGVEWFKLYNGLGNYDDEVSSMLLDKFGNILVSGISWGEINNSYDYLVIKYNPTITSVNEIESKAHKVFSLVQNYPNPFNPSTTISWQSPISGWQTLKVYDVLGNEITTLVNEENKAGYHSVDFNATNLPSGVYFYRIQSGNFIDTKKMILLK